MTEFKKTRWMNIVGAAGWAFAGAALFFNKLDELPTGSFLTVVAMYAGMVAVPAFTALALSRAGKQPLLLATLWANWAFIVLWIVSVAATAFLFPRGLAQSMLGVMAFVIPQAINIRAIRHLRASRSTTEGGGSQFPSIVG